jgi:hypothetical protein
MQVIVALAGLVVLWAAGFLVYYAVSMVVLRVVGLLLPLAGRRSRK